MKLIAVIAFILVINVNLNFASDSDSEILNDLEDFSRYLATVDFDSFTPKVIKQRFDHKNAHHGTWNERYYVDNRYSKNNDTIFLFIGGEEAMSPVFYENSQWMNYAKKYEAMIFYLEHRFYGNSFPSVKNCHDNDVTCIESSIKELSYLRSRLALEDLKHFIRAMNKKYHLYSAKWILFGTSYSGSLAAWMRLKHPHLVHAAVASSAPVLAKLNFKESMRITKNGIEKTSHHCVHEIKLALHEIRNTLAKKDGLTELHKEFKLCRVSQPDSKDIAHLHRMMYNRLSNLVQNNALEDDEKTSIQVFCQRMNSKGDLVARFRSALTRKSRACFPYSYKEAVDKYRNLSVDNFDREGRSWLYQQCTEFGFFITTDSIQQWFGSNFIPLDYYAHLCRDVFGKRFGNFTKLEENIEDTNRFYGGLDIVNRVTNVVFTHGSLDHWHALGITKSDNPEAPAIFIEGGSHSSDFDASSDDDSPQLVAARLQISSLIRKWLSQ